MGGGDPLPSWLIEKNGEGAEPEVTVEVASRPTKKAKKKVRPQVAEGEKDDNSAENEDDLQQTVRPARKREPPRRLADYV